MPKLLTMEWPELTEFSFTSKTPEDAVQRTLSGSRAECARVTNATLRGLALVDCWWTFTQATFVLSNGRQLRVFPYARRVDWELTAVVDSPRPAEAMSIGSAPIEFEWDGGITVWNPSADLIARTASGPPTMRKVLPGMVWLRVYLGEMRPLWFWLLRRRDDGQPFLYWHDLDSD